VQRLERRLPPYQHHLVRKERKDPSVQKVKLVYLVSPVHQVLQVKMEPQDHLVQRAVQVEVVQLVEQVLPVELEILAPQVRQVRSAKHPSSMVNSRSMISRQHRILRSQSPLEDLNLIQAMW
jgi:hypothetical protein